MLEFIDRWSGTILGLSALYLAGVLLGALAVAALSQQDQAELHTFMITMLNLSQAGDGGGALLWPAVQANLQMLFFIWLAGLSIIGVVGIWGLMVWRGFIVGFTLAFLAAQFGANGLWIALAGLLPGLLLQVPGLILGGTAGVAFSLSMIKAWREGRRPASFYPVVGAYTITLLVMGSGLLLAGLVQGGLVPHWVSQVMANRSL
jgi:stage II sporulation protein M